LNRIRHIITRSWEKNRTEIYALIGGGYPGFITKPNPVELGHSIPVFCYHEVNYRGFKGPHNSHRRRFQVVKKNPREEAWQDGSTYRLPQFQWDARRDRYWTIDWIQGVLVGCTPKPPWQHAVSDADAHRSF